jgi:CHASE3 domain sensor protein
MFEDLLRHWSLKRKLIGGFGVIMLAMVLAEIFSFVQIRRLSAYVSKSATIHELTAIGTQASDMIGLERAIILYSIFDDRSNVQQFKARLRQASGEFQRSLNSVGSRVSSSEAKQAVDTLRSKYATWAGMDNEIISALDGQQVDVAEKKVADSSFNTTVDDMRRLADQMSDYETRSLDHDASSAVVACLIGFGIIAVVIIAVGAGVLLYVRRVSDILGNLTNTLAGNSQQVETLSIQVNAASESLARESSAQAASLEETSASSEEITAMTRRNVESSKSAAALMSKVDDFVQAGNRTLESMVISMQEINSSSGKISKIIRVIDDIAFQTNILALNAAVEAARAGELGMGFAVVADEVRNLAQRSAQAAKDTAGMIEESIVKSGDGQKRLNDLSEMIRSITESSSKVKALVDNVNHGSQEQARGIEQISTAVNQMEKMTSHTATTTSETARASDQLSAEARDLSQVVVHLRSLVDGH